MHQEDIEYFSKFLSEFQDETDRGAALVGAQLIDDRLYRILKSHLLQCKEAEDLLDRAYSPLSSFSSRILSTYCLGLITRFEFDECNTIKKVRNAFAHSLHGLNFQDQRIRHLCSNLKSAIPEGTRSIVNAREQYINSVILTSLRLWYRSEHAEPYKAKERKWPEHIKP